MFNGIYATGIDISTHNVINDYKTVAKNIDFAIVKATQGHSVSGAYSMFTDSKFVQHLNGLADNGVECGVYHYLTAKTIEEAKKEAEYFCNIIAPHKHKIKLWAAVDVEEEKYLPMGNKTLLTSIVTEFCRVVQARGFKPMVYTNPNFLTYHMNNITQYDLWLALWRDKEKIPNTYPNMKIWQYGLTTVPGIPNQVDGNIGMYAAGFYRQQVGVEKEGTIMDEKNNIANNVGVSEWAAADWKLAQELGITDGTRPLDNVTRQEAVVMILRALGKANSKLK